MSKSILWVLPAVLAMTAAPAWCGLREDFQACEQSYFPRLQRRQPAPNPTDAGERYCLGLAYSTGYDGILTKSRDLAAPWFQRAANQGYAPAQTMIGYYYEQGYGVPQNYATAMSWYQKAAAQNNADGMFNIGRLHRSGKGVPQSAAEALKWFRRAAELGNEEAIQEVHRASLHNPSLPGQDVFAEGYKAYTAKNYTRSAELFRQAAERGNSRAQAFLGCQYEFGLGVAANAAEAAKWYRKAAEQGHDAAMKALGQLYELGRGVPENWAEAVRWYQRSAALKNPEGLFALGRMYQFGMGVPQNRWKAIELFEKAADQDNPNAGYFARWLRDGTNCIGYRNKQEQNRFMLECLEPAGIAFANSAQRWNWMVAAETYLNWKGRMFAYRRCVSGGSGSPVCNNPGPAPYNPW